MQCTDRIILIECLKDQLLIPSALESIYVFLIVEVRIIVVLEQGLEMISCLDAWILLWFRPGGCLPPLLSIYNVSKRLLLSVTGLMFFKGVILLFCPRSLKMQRCLHFLPLGVNLP